MDNHFLPTTTMTTSKISDISTSTKLSFCEKHYAKTARNFVDQFADDTKMLGFRYLHSRYRTWFRVMWALFLFMALTLTIYQVVERISYYLFKNPLTTKRSFETLSSIPFPTIVLCNKMQLKASKVASYNPKLLSLMSEIFADDDDVMEGDTGRRNISNIMNEIKSVVESNYLEIYKNSHQTVDDFIVNCQYGRKKQCIDNINIHLTPNGVCFAISPNITVTRPGPESTLSLLLNLETYDIIPGMVPDSGVILSIYDRNYSNTRLYDDGFHLEGGKLVTIPINDIRKLHRHPTECGKVLLDIDGEYSKQACQWHKKSQRIEKTCDCVPFISPINKEVFSEFNYKSIKNNFNITREPCKLDEEYECVRMFVEDDDIKNDISKLCPEDCDDIRYNTIVFGNELDVGELSSLLPVNWEDEKERRIEKFFKAIELMPKKRIPIIKSIQKLATEAQVFISTINKILNNFKNLDIIKAVDIVDTPYCNSVLDPNVLSTLLREINANERIWKHYIIYYNYVFKPNIVSLLKFFHLENDDSLGSMNSTFGSDIIDKISVELNLLSKTINDPEKVFGLKSMTIHEKKIVSMHVENLITNTKTCIQNWKENNAEESTTKTISLKCHDTFKKYLHPFEAGKNVADVLSKANIAEDYFVIIKNLTNIIQKVTSKNGAEIFNYKNFNIDIRKFRNDYRDDGKELGIIFELLKCRKVLQSKIPKNIYDVVERIDSFIKDRNEFYMNVSIINNNIEIEYLNNSIECFSNFSINIQLLKRYPFMRGDWMIRLQRDIQTAQSYSSGQQFDKVNLLHVKLYFTHIKSESITNVRSYNLFLILAEIGGTIGLYVGATLLTVAETIVFLFENHVKTKFGVIKNKKSIRKVDL
uniref:Acid-sensing ion channel 1 n=1 Tax=Strongyloides venezuelensis TaxID=75913 RepID=A0A0K0EU25_STRVS